MASAPLFPFAMVIPDPDSQSNSSVTADRHYLVTKRFVWTLFILALILLIADIVLITQNRTLKLKLVEGPPSLTPLVGRILPRLEGVDRKGEPVRLDWAADAKDTFLFVFSPRCAVCRENWPVWQELAKSVDSQSHRLVYVNTLPPLPKDYAEQMGIADAIVIDELDPKMLIAANIRMTPEVIRISAEGKIEQFWLGLIEDQELTSLRHALAR